MSELIPDSDPIFEACKRGDLGYVKKKLGEGYSVDSTGQTSLSLMGYAISRGDLDMAKLLLEHGLKPDANRNKFGQTYLMLAGVTKPLNLGMVRLLIEGGADVDARDKYGVTPLLQAAGSPYADLLQLLISKGASVHAKGEKGQTAFWYAAQGGRVENLEILYMAGAREHGADADGHTPLIRAALRGFPEACHWLLAHGADKYIADKGKKTALDHAKERGHAEVVALLERFR